jgi:hypothetical protein
MTDTLTRKPPLPVVQSFLTCHEIFRGQRSGAWLLLSPTAHAAVRRFPTHVQLAIHAEFTGGHGSYQPQLCLRDAAGEVVWGWNAPLPFEHSDPLLPTQVVFNDLKLAVPRAGRYSLALLLNGEEVAQRTMWFGPVEAFRSAQPT